MLVILYGCTDVVRLLSQTGTVVERVGGDGRLLSRSGRVEATGI